jgi:SsrA-binding protein
MSKKNNKSKKAAPKPEIKMIADNRKARHRFEVVETLECGISLVGSEVKSLRDGNLSLDEAYGRVRAGEVWLMHRTEIQKFANLAHQNGLTLVPLRMYFNNRGIAKVLLGLCKGKKMHDKREALKKADVKREIDRAMRRR